MNPSRAERLWRTLPDVRARERPRFLFFAGLATVVSLAQTIGLAGSEALFLAEFGAGRLPLTFVGAALFTVAGSMAYAMRVGSARNDDLFVQMLTGAGIALALATVAVAGGATWVLPLLFCFFYLSQAVFVNHLWTFCGDYFDTIASKRVLPLLTVGASVGGVLGGLFAAFATGVVGPAGLVAAWGVLLLAAALIVRLGRRNLRRWGPLELEEADETSVEGIRSATRYLRASTLGRWLVLSASGMMLALFIAQYLYSGIFAERFQTSAELAAFFGLFLAITNLIEIAIEIGLTPLLIRRLGVPTANLVHPLFTIATFAGLAFHYGFATGIAARMNKELLENALAAPVRALVYNAIPMRFRGRTRAFVEGIVVYAGMAAAGLVLLLLGDPDPLWLGIAGGAAALLYLIANLRSRREYLRTLVNELRAGRIDLEDIGDEIGDFEVSRLAELWEALLRAETAEATRPLLALVPTLAARGVIEPLLRAASHPRPDVRHACVEAIADWGGDGAEATLRGALDDPDATIRLAALKGLARLGTDLERLLPDLRPRLSDPDPLVRARAAVLVGEEADDVLRAMIAAGDPARATAALDAAPARLMPEAEASANDANPAVRAAALACLARIATGPPRALHEILPILEDPSPAVRCAALRLLARLDAHDAAGAIARALADPAAEVVGAAEAALGELGEAGALVVEASLRSDREREVGSAVRILAACGRPGDRERLALELRHRTCTLWSHVIAYQHTPAGDGLGARFLRAAYGDGVLRNRRLAFAILELIEDPRVVRNVEKALRFGSRRRRGDALEVLSHLGDREAARLLVLLHEAGSLAERIRGTQGVVSAPRDPDAVLASARRSEVRWIRLGAEVYDAGAGETRPEEPSMERLLALRQIPFFKPLTLEQLEAVLQIMREVEYVANEVIVRQGDPGSELFLLIEGQVRYFRNYGSLDEQALGVGSAVSYFGEMAALGNENRLATVVASSPARMLCLDGVSLKELILQMPEIAFEIFGVLTSRVRTAEARLAKGPPPGANVAAGI